MGFEWQFGTQSRAGRPPANRIVGFVEIVDSAARDCKNARGELRESVSTGREYTDGSACESTSARRD